MQMKLWREQAWERRPKLPPSQLIASVGSAVISVAAHFHMCKKRPVFSSMLSVLHQKVALLRWMTSPGLAQNIVALNWT